MRARAVGAVLSAVCLLTLGPMTTGGALTVPPAAASTSAAAWSATIRGRVVDPVTGAPLAGRTVVVHGGVWNRDVGSAVTQADGRYRLAGLHSDQRYRVRVEPDEPSDLTTYAPGVVAEVDSPWVAPPATVDVAVQRGFWITGRYRAPGPDAEKPRVLVTNLDRSDAGYGNDVEPDVDGSWQTWVPPGRYAVSFSIPEEGGAFWYGGATHPVAEDLAGAAVLRVGPGLPIPVVDVTEPAQALIRVRVVDARTRRPLPQPCVEQFDGGEPPGPGSSRPSRLPLFSDSDCPKGAAPDTTSVKGGRDVVKVSGGPGYLATLLPVRVRRGQVRDYTVALRRAGLIRGRAVDAATGRPLRDPGCATAYPRGSWPSVRRSARFDCLWTQGDGRFLVPAVPPGLVTVGVTGSAHDYPERYAKGADTDAGATTYRVVGGRTLDVGTVRLRRAGTVRGRVLDSAGQPVAGATVALSRPGWWREDVPSATTDVDGRYTLEGVPGGRVRLTISPPPGSVLPDQWLGGLDERHATVVPSRWGAVVTAPDARLTPGGTLRVQVPAGHPSVFVEVFDSAGRPVGTVARVGADGVAVLSPLPATGLRVHAWSDGLLDPAQGWFGGHGFADADPVVVPAGSTTTITVPIRSPSADAAAAALSSRGPRLPR